MFMYVGDVEGVGTGGNLWQRGFITPFAIEHGFAGSLPPLSRISRVAPVQSQPDESAIIAIERCGDEPSRFRLSCSHAAADMYLARIRGHVTQRELALATLTLEKIAGKGTPGVTLGLEFENLLGTVHMPGAGVE